MKITFSAIEAKVKRLKEGEAREYTIEPRVTEDVVFTLFEMLTLETGYELWAKYDEHSGLLRVKRHPD